ncbi:MAG: patatin-like phospholipase family protein [Myxococcota bacterium]|nr:patatin-like phospholipase family protein [Myxococcota bacterium]
MQRLLLLGLALAVCSATAPGGSAAAPDPAPERPRIGLVLSGGGARGAAHIGVIQVLEELRVPVDVIAGTSMGSIIGGLYALGRSPEDMKTAISRIDWIDVFRDDTGRKDFSFRRKQDDFRFLTSLRLGFKDGSFFIPAGLIQGQKLDFWLNALTLTRHGSGRFDDLRLPFKAVATDVETGAPVVIEHGEIATALRASMSIPGAFAPVDIAGRRLVDGGTANNLPVDVAQAMGADVIIAVDIATPLRTAGELTSAVAISAQMIGIPIQQNQAIQIERLGERDVLLKPQLGTLGTASFTRLAEAIEIGAENARAHAETLRALSVSESEYQAWRKQQRQPEPPLPVIAQISIENDTVLDDGVLRSLIDTRPGEQLDLSRLANDLGRVHGTDAFDLVRFDLTGPGGTDLVIRAEGRARGTHHLRLGITLNTDFDADSSFTIATNHVAYPLDGYGREWRSHLKVGHTIGLGSEIYQPLDVEQRLYLVPSLEFLRQKFAVYDDRPPAKRQQIARYDENLLTLGFEAGINLSNIARAQGGIGWVLGQIELDTGDRASQGIGLPLPPNQQSSGAAVLFELDYDTLDNTHFPNDGSIGSLSGIFLEEALGWQATNRRLDLSWRSFRTWRRNTLGLGVNYDTLLEDSTGPTSQSVFEPRLGGFSNLGGFPRGSIPGEKTVLGWLAAYRRVASPVVFAWDFPVYVGSIVEVGSAWDGERDDIPPGVDPLLWSLTAFAGVETPLGPLYVAYAYGEGGSQQGYLALGQAF